MPTLDENDRRQIAGGDDFLHGPDIGPPRLGQ
jgi:hypothetical protein